MSPQQAGDWFTQNAPKPTPITTPTPAHDPAQPSIREAAGQGITKFLDAAADWSDPIPMLKQLYEDLSPINVLKGPFHVPGMAQNIARQSITELEAAKAAYDKGDMKEALWRTLAAAPILGPIGRQLSQDFEAGEYAAMGGHTAAVVGPALLGRAAPAVVGAVEESAAGQAVARTANAVGTRAANALDASAASNLRRAAAPITNSRENRAMGKQMEAIAPQLLREPGLNAVTRGGYLEKLEAGKAAAGEAIDQALATVDPAKQLQTAPIVAKLRGQIARLQAQTEDRGGLTPAVRADHVNAIKKAIDEVQSLGPQANYQNLAKLRQAWDEGGKATRTPKIAPDYQKQITTGAGWADAADVLREELGKASPEVAKANANWSLYKKAADIVDAAEQTASARPKVGRTAVAAMTGAVAGGSIGHETIGVAIGLMADAAAQSGLTARIGAARLMTQLADAIRAKQMGQARSLAYRLAQTTGTTAQVAGPLQAFFGGMAPVPAHAQDRER